MVAHAKQAPGGIAAIGLFGKNWSPKKCIAFFQRFARNIFPSRRSIGSSFFATIKRFFTFYLEDGRYDAAVLEGVLQEALGLSPIFAPQKSRTSGIKYAVTATTIADATLCLMSNYNGEGGRGKDLSASAPPRIVAGLILSLGHKHLRATQPAEDLLLWEA